MQLYESSHGNTGFFAIAASSTLKCKSFSSQPASLRLGLSASLVLDLLKDFRSTFRHHLWGHSWRRPVLGGFCSPASNLFPSQM